jgi:hypothetical protein
VTIIRRHHPLRGQLFEVLQGGRERITIRLQDGTSMRIPRDWTDADGDTGSGQVESIFTAESLRRMLELVDAFCRR